VKEGGGEEGERERERARKVRLHDNLVCVYYCSTYYKAVCLLLQYLLPICVCLLLQYRITYLCVFITAVPYYLFVCVYYCNTYYKAVRVGGGKCVFITAVPITTLCVFITAGKGKDLFIGTQFGNLYTAVHTPARGRVDVCLVFVCLVFVCKYVLGHSRVCQPLNLRLCLLRHLGLLTPSYASLTCRRRRLNSYRLLRRSTPGPPPIPWAHLLHLPASPRPPLYTSTMTT
jgi:hypothetical protein